MLRRDSGTDADQYRYDQRNNAAALGRVGEERCVHIYADRLHLVGNGTKPATMPVTVPVLRVLEARRGQRVSRPLILRLLTANTNALDAADNRQQAFSGCAATSPMSTGP